MPAEQGLGFGDIGPFCETLAPPLIILRDGMKLRQVEGNNPCQQIVGIITHNEFGEIPLGKSRRCGHQDSLLILASAYQWDEISRDLYSVAFH